MSDEDHDWQERVSNHSAPHVLLEHELRYRSAVPIIAAAQSWVDLGTGAGVAAGRGVEVLPPHAVLVDIDADAVAEAGHRWPTARTEVMDLCEPGDLERLVALLGELPSPVTITAFEMVEHLTDHMPLLAVLLDAVRSGDTTVVLSVPNDAFTGVENPYHPVTWGADSFAELLHALPAERVVARQVPFAGSAMYVGETTTLAVEQEVGMPAGGAPSHFIVAFGPACSMLGSVSAVEAVDTISARVWERQRESDLAYYQARAAQVTALEAYVKELEAR